jgi:hypothetical protein
MTPDPCWFPSAVMQTAGAILGFYIVIYIFLSEVIENRMAIITDLTLRSVSSEDLQKLRAHIRRLDEIFDNMRPIFYLTIIVGGLAILVATVWLDSFTTHILGNFKTGYGGLITLLFFVFFIILVVSQSIYIIHQSK